MTFYLYLTIPILLTTCWLYTAQVTRSSASHIRGKRICLLIAHPDDEAMFFSPTLLALTAPETGNHVKILCLSTGNADSLGPIRRKELLASASLLGIRDPPSDVLILDSPDFPDSMTKSWSPNAIISVLSSAFTSPQNKIRSLQASSSSTAPHATIDILLTFDAHGISTHPNHISLFHGAHAWLSALMTGKSGWQCPVELYVLTTTSLVRKYMSVLDAPITMLLGVLRSARGKGQGMKAGDGEGPGRILFVSDPWQWMAGQRAMVRGHQSQMRWFRWGWVGLGRYMIINEVRREDIKIL